MATFELFRAFRRGFPDPGRTWGSNLQGFKVKHPSKFLENVRDLLRESWFNTKCCFSWVIIHRANHFAKWSPQKSWFRRKLNQSKALASMELLRSVSYLKGKRLNVWNGSVVFWGRRMIPVATIPRMNFSFSEQNWCRQLLAVSTMTTVATTKKKKNYKKN